jgi:hypothetical protein
MQVTGKIKMIDQTKEVGSGGFKKRDIVVTTDEQYPQHILIQFVQDKCDILNSYKINQDVVIDINLKGREWTNAKGETVYFNTIQGWRIAKPEPGAKSAPPTDQSAVNNYEARHAANSNEDEPDDLPF